MFEYFSYYAASNIVCIIIFGIMLVHDLSSVDRQEKQIKYDHALIAFMLYFASDTVWVGVDSGVLPVTKLSVVATNFSNYVIMVAVTFMWLRYVMAVEKDPNRGRLSYKLVILLPFIISTIVYVATFCLAPEVLISDDLKPQLSVYLFLIAVPYFYIVIVVIYTARNAVRETNPIERKTHLFVGLFPLIVMIGGLIETLVAPTMPIFSYSCTIVMLVFYIQSMDSRISTDPLTGLNNRGQLARYASQSFNMHREGRLTYVVMVDIDDFKLTNDTYGHAEGDNALVILANSLKNAVKHYAHPTFLGRYGGDEFVLIAHPTSEAEISPLVDGIRAQIDAECRAQKTPYRIDVSIGYALMEGEDDTYQKCMKRADQMLYHDKALRKQGSSL